MIVCICKAVSDRQIRTAATAGATCVRDLAKSLGVGTCCGKCVPEARAALAASAYSTGSAQSVPALLATS